MNRRDVFPCRVCASSDTEIRRDPLSGVVYDHCNACADRVVSARAWVTREWASERRTYEARIAALEGELSNVRALLGKRLQGAPRKLSGADADAIVAEYCRGDDLETVARRWGVGWERVRMILRDRKVKMRTRGQRGPVPAPERAA